MRTFNSSIIAVLFGVLGLFFSVNAQQDQSTTGSSLIHPKEKHFSKITQLTFGGINAEAYFSFDEKRIIFQSTRDTLQCDQIFTMDVDGKNVQMVSTGKGRTTCAYFYPDGKHILYSSTHLGGDECPPPPDRSKGYVWAVYKSYDVFMAKAGGSDLKQLTNADGYDAEAVISPTGDKIVFCSARDGDLEIYTMNLDGSDQKRLTFDLGYDGGPFFLGWKEDCLSSASSERHG